MAISSSSSSNCQRKKPAATGLWWFTFICAAMLYLLTCQRGVSWQDSGMFQWRVLNSDLTGDLGLALAHPLYIATGKLFMWFPLGDMPMRLNFLSGMGMAVALANLAAVLFLLTGKRWIGFIIAAMCIGVVMGGSQSLARSTYSKMLPETTDHTSFFSFYDVMEKLATVAGTFSFGIIEAITGSMRYSVLAICIFFMIGSFFMLLLLRKGY